MVGFQRQPFSIHEKETERLPRELLKNYKIKPREEREKIKEEIKRLKEEKLKASAVANQEEEKRKVETEKTAREQEKKTVTSKRNLGKSAAQKITLLGLRNISYKDLDTTKKDTFDPKMLITEDDNDDEEYRQIMKKFEIIKEEVASPQSKPKQARGGLTSRITRKSINLQYVFS